MGNVQTAEIAGSIIRRVREDAGLSRSQLADKTGIAPRSLYALETGEAENFGLGRYLKLLDALGLSMAIGYDNSNVSSGFAVTTASESAAIALAPDSQSAASPMPMASNAVQANQQSISDAFESKYPLADIWRLDEGSDQ